MNKNLQKVINLKDKIEKEITEINLLYETINNKVTKSFEKKYEILIKKEKDIKR